MNHPAQFLPFVLILLIYGLLYLVTKLLVAYHKMKKRKSPFKDNLLRSPGEWLRKQLDDINLELNVNLSSAFAVPLAVYAVVLTQAYFGGKAVSASLVLYAILTVAAFEAYFIFKLVKLISTRRKFRLGYEGELAVGQQLNQLLRDGYYVYHDFSADKFNIDHIVVGPAGVYAVETKARRIPDTGSGQSDAKVIYDGQKLHFPDWTETKPLEQARLRAQWLSKWLSSAVGDPIHAKPVIVLPGWFVDRMSPNGVSVINPKQFKSVLNSDKDKKLDEKMIARIIHQLDQRCRDLHPRAGDGLGGSPGLDG